MFAIKISLPWWIAASYASGLSFLCSMVCANGWWNTRHATMPGDVLAHQLTAQLGGLSLSAFAALLLLVLISNPADA